LSENSAGSLTSARVAEEVKKAKPVKATMNLDRRIMGAIATLSGQGRQ